jgi:TatD DNase family protein
MPSPQTAIRSCKRARDVGVRAIVIPGVAAEGWRGLLALCDAHADLYPALGLHPVAIDAHQDDDVRRLERAIAAHRPVAVGEIGLDGVVGADAGCTDSGRCSSASWRSPAPPSCRCCCTRARPMTRSWRRLRRAGCRNGGIAHAFNGSLEQAKRYIDLGFRLGFGGMLTFERSTRLRRLARELPLEAMVLETDAPDLTVASHRYQRNSPEYLPEILAALARVRGAEPAQIAAQTSANAVAVLGLELGARR